MIVYFANRTLDILGMASTELRTGLVIVDDLKTEDVDSGVAIFECEIPYNTSNRAKVETCTSVGNYLLRSNDGENEFYTIIESEADTKKQTVYVYAEDAGMDLLNEIVGEYEADKAYPISHYVNKYANDTGFQIGINEIENLTRALKWEGETTAAERIASVATQFDNAEISYSFDIKGLKITNKYINIYKKRGKDSGVQLRLNREVDRIITKKSVANLCTSLQVTGGIPEGEENPITLNGYSYDDGNFYVSGNRLNSREALKKWSRYVWEEEPNQQDGYTGHIVGTYSYDTTSQSELCNRAVSRLKELCEIEVNYEIEISELPDNVRLGDYVNIVDDEGELYLSTRLLQLEVSETKDTRKAILGDFLIKGSGISQKVAELAELFEKTSASASKALIIADSAKARADTAWEQADSALQESQKAQESAEIAQSAADRAEQAATEAQSTADNASEAVNEVRQNISSLENSIEAAQAAAETAYKAAESADTKAIEAKEAVLEAQRQTNIAKETADAAKSTADEAVLNATTAQTTADTAKELASAAQVTAEAAKLDAEKANQDITSLGESLETLSSTMTLEYARKTDLTAAEAELQTQISQNAAEISSTAQKVQTIDETANNAAEQAALAQTVATAAQTKADQASADAVIAQTKADEASTAAANAQSEADKAKQAAATAKTVADKAEADLTAAKEDLATVSGRVDATEEEITAAQLAVEAAQAAADKAQADVANATAKAENAQTVADAAVADAASAQTVANDAASKAELAQKTADTAKGDAAAAQASADAAVTAAAEAQRTADTAKTNAASAQTKADEAAAQALAAQSAADDADTKATQAAVDLEKAKENLANVTSRVDATAEDVAAAQAAVTAAQNAADKAQADAVAAQNTANTAQANAASAQTAANTAKEAADAAQTAATEAKSAADKAQADVDSLAVRTTMAETKIQQNSEKIELAATKTEVEETLGGYYTKAESDAAIKVVSDAIALKVSTTDFNSYKTTVTGQISTAKSEAISTAASDATTKANSAKSEAISTAASDATTKANNALASAKSYTDSEITVVNESLTTTNQEISVMKGQIALKVEQTDIDTAVTTVKSYADNQIENNDPVIIGTQTAATGTWTGVAPFASLADGQRITYWLPYAGSGNATLNLTLSGGGTTGAVNCYYGGTTRLTTHYPAGSSIRLIYREGVSIGSTSYTGWWADANYDSNTYDRTKYSGAVKASAAIVAGNLIVGNSSGYHHLKTGGTFDINYPILYAGSAISSGSTGTNNYIVMPVTITTTQSLTLTAYKALYIKGALSGSTFTPVSTAPITQTVPTSEDGYYYILLGTAYSTTAFYLLAEHPIYKYVDGAFQQAITQFTSYSTTTQMNSAITAAKDEINLSVSQKYATIDNVTGIETRLSTAESSITAQASSIALCVKEADVTGNYLISKINLSSTTATIAASHINLAGAVTISALADDTKTQLDTATSNASTALTNAATAQTTANTAVSNAATAQTTANTAVSNAATAQTTANTASTNATTALGYAQYHYGTCATAAATVAKVVALSGFKLYTGATVSVKFTYANTAASPTLNVNSTGAKAIYAYGAALTASSPYNWVAGSTVLFTYNGTQWEMTDASLFTSKWRYNQTTNINGGYIQTNTVDAAVLKADTTITNTLYATDLHISGDSTFDGDITAKSLYLKDTDAYFRFGGKSDEYIYESPLEIGFNTGVVGDVESFIDISNTGISLFSGLISEVSSAGNDFEKYAELYVSPEGIEAVGAISSTGNITTSGRYVTTRTGGIGYVQQRDGSDMVGFGVDSSGGSRGIYDYVQGEWMIREDSNNNVLLPKVPIVGGHSTSIGSILTASGSKSAASATYTALCSITLPAGAWIVVGSVRSATTASGYLAATFSTTSGSNDGYNNAFGTFVNGSTFGNIKTTVPISVTSSTVYYLNGAQSSGSAQTLYGYIRAMRIA